MRIVFGMAGLASVTALLTAMLPSVTPSQAAAFETVGSTTAAAPEPSVLHVTRVVTLGPGQTAPPNATVVQPDATVAPPNAPVVVKPKPAPRVRVKAVTKQSGG
jgi:ABC-type Fe3+-hydroxamate transport system substrate-binding protein